MAKRYYDEGMISEDRSSMANLPQQVVIKKYPKPEGFLKEDLNDGLSGVDSQVSKDRTKRNSNLQPEKY